MRKLSKKWRFSLICLLLLSLLTRPAHAAEEKDILTFADEVSELISLSESLPATISPEDGEFQTARLIVKAPGPLETAGTPLATAEGYDALHILQYATPEEARDACAAYQTMDGVLWAEPDQLVSLGPLEFSENLPARQSGHLSWGYQSEWCGADPYLDHIRETLGEACPETVVAVADSGVFAEHSFLKGRVLPGYNFVNSGVDASDDFGHGSHVAGTIADGTPDNVKILPVKVLNSSGSGTSSQISLGIRYAAGQGADVLNMSFNFKSANRVTQEAVDYAVSNDVCVIVSAGNDGQPVSGKAPACFENVVAVAAAGRGEGTAPAAWPKTAYGPEVDVTAPGVGIQSISHTDPNNCSVLKTGTSMAAPHVSAAAALILTLHPDASPETVRDMLVRACDTTPVALNDGVNTIPGLIRFSNLLSLENGFADDTVHVGTERELLNLASALELGAIPDAGRDRRILLEADLDMDGVFWKPPRFAGVFDGQGHSVSNLAPKPAGDNSGFFSTLEAGSSVKNLQLKSLNLQPLSGGSYHGGIAGYSEGSILDCSVEGTVNASGSGYVGGIAGYSAGEIKNCVFRGSVAAREYAGGVCGACVSLVNCVNEGSVSASDGNSGGLAGAADSLRNCASLGSASAYYGPDGQSGSRVLSRGDGTYYLEEPVRTGALDGGGAQSETSDLLTALNRCAVQSAADGLHPWLQTSEDASFVPASVLEGVNCTLVLAGYENGQMKNCALGAPGTLNPGEAPIERKLFILDPDTRAPLFRAAPL